MSAERSADVNLPKSFPPDEQDQGVAGVGDIRFETLTRPVSFESELELTN